MAPRSRAGYVSAMLARKPDPTEIDAAAEDAEDDAAMAEYEADGGISNTAVMAWVRSWGTDRELSPPEVGD
jgi:predicted transcriptional regulator